MNAVTERQKINYTMNSLLNHLHYVLSRPETEPELRETLWLMIEDLESAHSRLLDTLKEAPPFSS